jgi:hypothetical protein
MERNREKTIRWRVIEENALTIHKANKIIRSIGGTTGPHLKAPAKPNELLIRCTLWGQTDSNQPATYCFRIPISRPLGRASRQDSAKGHSTWDRSHFVGPSFHASHRKPVIPPPAKHAANRAESKQPEEAIERMQLAWFELNRVTARAHSSNPQHPGQPIRPGHRCNVHCVYPFSRMRSSITGQLHRPR